MGCTNEKGEWKTVIPKELDSQIHNEIIGKGPGCCCGPRPIGDNYDPMTGECYRCGYKVCPDYSTDIGAAWKIVSKLCINGGRFSLTNDRIDCWQAVFLGSFYGIAEEESPSLAICNAALMAVREKEK